MGSPYVIPESSQEKHWVPDGAMAVYRGRDSGNRWEKLTQGLPQRNAYLGMLREGMATDTLDPCGIYVATNTGQIFASRDEGDSWNLLRDYLPPIYSITFAVVEGYRVALALFVLICLETERVFRNGVP